MYCRPLRRFFAFLDLCYFPLKSFSVGVDLRFCCDWVGPRGVGVEGHLWVLEYTVREGSGCASPWCWWQHASVGAVWKPEYMRTLVHS